MGVALGDQGVGVAVLNPSGGLELAEHRPADAGVDGWAGALRAAVHDHGLQRCPCVAVVPRDSYQVQQLEALEVPADELQTAVRWRLKDVVDVPLEQAVTDVILVPPPPTRDVANMLYGIVARRQVMDEYADLIDQAGLHITALEIREMAVRNLAALCPEQGGGIAVLAVDSDEGLLMVSREESLYLARSLEIGGIHLRADTSQVSERLALEVQRSLDYYDSQLYGAPPSRVLLLPLTEFDEAAVVSDLNTHLGASVEMLELEQWLATPDSLSSGQQQRAALAIGAALRLRPGGRA